MKPIRAIDFVAACDAGLLLSGVDGDGELEWIGKKEQFINWWQMKDGVHDCNYEVGDGDGHCNHWSHKLYE